jgi:hypothetical protein
MAQTTRRRFDASEDKARGGPRNSKADNRISLDYISPAGSNRRFDLGVPAGMSVLHLSAE